VSGEACPLCGAPLHPEQAWCLSCGAAARTRLAASPAWRAPIVALVVVIVLALGVLAGSLVKLAGGSPAPSTQTTTVTVAATTTPTASTTTTTATGAIAAPTDTATTSPRAVLPGTGKGSGKLSPAVRKTLEEDGLNPNKIKRSVAERLSGTGLGTVPKR
jgi:pyruvate/2-oxoglutarate dehydrogenase complex dihydrolipoamide acyltransferase (E2) component